MKQTEDESLTTAEKSKARLTAVCALTKGSIHFIKTRKDLDEESVKAATLHLQEALKSLNKAREIF